MADNRNRHEKARDVQPPTTEANVTTLHVQCPQLHGIISTPYETASGAFSLQRLYQCVDCKRIYATWGMAAGCAFQVCERGKR